jgi:hypothetical protein
LNGIRRSEVAPRITRDSALNDFRTVAGLKPASIMAATQAWMSEERFSQGLPLGDQV